MFCSGRYVWLPIGRRISVALMVEGISGRQFQGKSDASHVTINTLTAMRLPSILLPYCFKSPQHLNNLTLQLGAPYNPRVLRATMRSIHENTIPSSRLPPTSQHNRDARQTRHPARQLPRSTRPTLARLRRYSSFQLLRWQILKSKETFVDPSSPGLSDLPPDTIHNNSYPAEIRSGSHRSSVVVDCEVG